MSKYQDPNFDKEYYWKLRKARPADQTFMRRMDRQPDIIKAHTSVDWPKKQVSKKAFLKNTKRARKYDANIPMEVKEAVNV